MWPSTVHLMVVGTKGQQGTMSSLGQIEIRVRVGVEKKKKAKLIAKIQLCDLDILLRANQPSLRLAT